MPVGLIRSPAVTSAARGLLARYWKASFSPSRPPPYRLPPINARNQQFFYSAIADVMLKKAIEKAPVPTNKDLEKQLFPSSSPVPLQNGNIEEAFKKPRQTQSIGGYLGFKNSSAQPLNSISPNVRQFFKPRPRTASSSALSISGLPSVLNKHDSFQELSNHIDLTQKDTRRATAQHEAVHFNEDDFDDDDTLDLDMDYPLPSIAAPPKTLQVQPSPYQLPSLPRSMSKSTGLKYPSSSAQTWSSSSPSHKRTPPGALKRKEGEHVADTQIIERPDPNIRPAKRRTLPWCQDKAEEDERLTRQDEEEEITSQGHSTQSRRNNLKNGTADPSFTPLPKDKKMPWNTTASAMKEEKRLFKDKRKRKANESALDAMEAQNRKKALTMAPITLSEEQRRVLNLVVNDGKSVFFTGSAGTGKSVLMRAIIADLRKKFVREPDRVAVTASTGLAACNIGGVTLHSFGGIGLGKEDVPTLVKKIKRNQKAKNRWIRTKILIIDEISMVDGDLFDKLEGIARSIRNNGRPFGGIQLVITGDFFQLPPVPDFNAKGRGVKFAFDAGTWATAIHHTIGLTEVFRQKDPGICSEIFRPQ